MADLNNYYVERRNQFHKNVYQKLVRSNPFRGLVPVSAFDLSEGRNPTVRTLTHELPTSYPTALTEVQVSTGTDNPYCNPSSTTIKRGEIQRTFKLYGDSFKTDVVCLSDMKRAEDAANSVAGFERALSEYVSVKWSDWYRVQNIAMVDNKGSTHGSGVLEMTTSSAGDFTGLSALPDRLINWDDLRAVYWQLVRNGLADEMAVGRDTKGRPVLPLHASPGVIASLWGDQTVKDQVKYFDPQSNLAQLGYDGALYGFLPVTDLFPVRFGKASTGITAVSDLTFTNAIYPTVNANASVGRKYTTNSNYVSLARSGLAEYETVTILGRQVYEAKFEAVDPTSFAGMDFVPQNYVAEFQWIGGAKNRTFNGDNDRGNLGYYLADWRVGAKPIFPELGFSILTKATDV